MNANEIWERVNPFVWSGSINRLRLASTSFGRFKIRHSTVHEATPFLLNTNMTHPDQWGAQARDTPRPDVPYAKQPLPGVAPIQQDQRYIDSGAPFDSGRFKPKTRINDPIFLIVFVAQVPYRAVRFRLLAISRAGA